MHGVRARDVLHAFCGGCQHASHVPMLSTIVRGSPHQRMQPSSMDACSVGPLMHAMHASMIHTSSLYFAHAVPLIALVCVPPNTPSGGAEHPSIRAIHCGSDACI